MVRNCKELINFIDLLVYLECVIYYIAVFIEITLQTHSVLKQFCSAYHNIIVSKYCIFKDQTLLPLESCRHAIISAPNDCLLVNVDGWLTQEALCSLG